MSKEQVGFGDVTETKLVKSGFSNSSIDKDINIYLNMGWRIIERWVVGHGDPHERFETIHILLGWFDTGVEAPHPMPKKEDENSPF